MSSNPYDSDVELLKINWHLNMASNKGEPLDLYFLLNKNLSYSLPNFEIGPSPFHWSFETEHLNQKKSYPLQAQPEMYLKKCHMSSVVSTQPMTSISRESPATIGQKPHEEGP